MNKRLVISIICISTFFNSIIGQHDSIRVDLTLALSAETLPLSTTDIHVISTFLSLKGKKSTFVPGLIRKEIGTESGHLIGLNYYRKWNRGYAHGSLFYNPDKLYTRFSGGIDLHLNTWKGLVLDIGGNYFVENGITTIPSIGATYYFKNIMSSYTMRWSAGLPASHRIILRSYFGSNDNYFQVGYSSNSVNEIANNRFRLINNLHVFQAGLNKSVFKKTTAQILITYSFQSSSETSASKLGYTLAVKRNF